MIGCAGGGDCNGGDPSLVYEYGFNEGIPDSSCEQYVAHNLDKGSHCGAMDICRDCTWPPPPEGQSGLDKCWAVDYRKYYVSKLQFFESGADEMKADLYHLGPIACGIQATPKFEQTYKGGIYREKIENPSLNHEISIVGWGTDDDGVEYWIGRNSWGTYW